MDDKTTDDDYNDVKEDDFGTISFFCNGKKQISSKAMFNMAAKIMLPFLK